MAERRSRLRRLFVVALLAALVFLLLELNRFLPGSWPGGGGDAGVRPVPTGAMADPTRLTPSDGTPPEPERRKPRVRIVLRGADGEPIDAKIERDPNEAGTTVPAAGLEWTVDSDRGPLTFERPDGWILHGLAPETMPPTWVVQWQPVTRPKTRPIPRFTSVSTIDPQGAPIAGAEVEVRASGVERRGLTGVDGTARLLEGLQTFRACASAPGFGESCEYGSTLEPSFVLRLFPVKPYATRFVDPSGGA